MEVYSMPKTVKTYCAIIIIVLLSIIPCVSVYAQQQSCAIPPKNYEISEGEDFAVSNGTKVDKFCYDDMSIGSFSINGDIAEESEYGDFHAVSATGDLILGYKYNGLHQSANEEEWNLVSSNEKSISGCDTDGKIKMGAVLVQSSLDGENWEKEYALTDIFDSNITSLSGFYTITENCLKSGTYYRVVFAYEMEIKTDEKNIGPISRDVKLNKRFLEVCKFYASYGNYPIVFKDIYTGEASSENKKYDNGFVVEKGNTRFDVTVSKDGGETESVEDHTIYYEAGRYDFKITSELGKEYTRTMTIKNDMQLSKLSPKVYEGGKKGEYKEEVAENKGIASFGMNSLSSLSIIQSGGSSIEASDKGSFPAYGLTGNSVGIYMRLENPGAGWKYYDDDWGKKESQTVNGAWVGNVRKGALVIQKSTDGVNWERIDSSKYAKGLYTTDYSNYYSDMGDVLIYTPDGNDIINGVYLKISYAYNLQHNDSKDTNRCLEVYNMYLCNNDLNAVTFHNLSVDSDTLEKMISDTLGEDDDIKIDIYKGAESLISGSSTTTGFRIDTTMNPTVKYTVELNGQVLDIPEDKCFTETGKYFIRLVSDVGTEKNIILFVDRNSQKEAFKTYFGPGFIRGKRIYKEGPYPTYEGGYTQYHINENDPNFRSIRGTITNYETHEVINLSQEQNKIEAGLEEPGYYEAVFTTRPENETNLGDYWRFTLKFYIIEKDSAPGPQQNKLNLDEYASKNVSDCYPKYYGVTEKSNNRDITIAFADYEKAKDFAFKLEKAEAEKQDDGTYRYKDTNQDTQKIIYYDNETLTKAEDYFAEQRIQELYFDITDKYTYQTLDDTVISSVDDLRDLNLSNSVKIKAKGQEKKLCEKGAYEFPLISPKPYAYLSADKDTIEVGYNDFQFIRDDVGYDSSTFTISDKNGKEYDIDYNQNVGEQLQKQGCPSGIVNIKEKNIYGDSNKYQAIFIAKNDNTAEVTFTCGTNDTEEKVTINKHNCKDINVDYFSISDITDPLDPYPLIKITGERLENGKPYYCISDDLKENSDNPKDKIWALEGVYTVSVINRLGYSYSFNINVSGNAEVLLNFNGESENIATVYGATNVKLPYLTKAGNEFLGFEDENGNIYNDEIAEILFKGETVLKAKWEPKQYDLTLKDTDGREISHETIEYGVPFMLPELDDNDDMEFAGWLNNGEPVENNEFTLEQENDIILTASFIEKKHDNKGVIVISSLCVISAILSSVIFISRKGGKRHEKD